MSGAESSARASTTMTWLLPAALMIILPGGVLGADEIAPAVLASIHDEPVDGLGDLFNESPWFGLIRATSTREDRPIQEYDVSPYLGMTVHNATIAVTIFNNNGAGDWPRIFDFIIYEGNGQADLSDFQVPGITVTSAFWPAPIPALSVNVDVTAQLQALVDGGVTHLGFKVVGTSSNLFPCILDDDDAVLTIEASREGDFNGDGDVDLLDYEQCRACITGPDGAPYDPACQPCDMDDDDDIDLTDYSRFQGAFTG